MWSEPTPPSHLGFPLWSSLGDSLSQRVSLTRNSAIELFQRVLWELSNLCFLCINTRSSAPREWTHEIQSSCLLALVAIFGEWTWSFSLALLFKSINQSIFQKTVSKSHSRTLVSRDTFIVKELFPRKLAVLLRWLSCQHTHRDISISKMLFARGVGWMQQIHFMGLDPTSHKLLDKVF